MNALDCHPDEHGRCLTCMDEALMVRVLQVDPAMAVAQVALDGEIAEVDISLLDDVAVGQWLLVHGGVALEHLSQNIVQI